MGRIITCIVLLQAWTLWAGPDGKTTTFQFREPVKAQYQVESASTMLKNDSEWVASIKTATGETVHWGNRVALKLHDPASLSSLIEGRPLTLVRQMGSRVFVLQAPDALTAMKEAERLGNLIGVEACAPVSKRDRQLHSPYAYASNDPYVFYAWNLEHRSNPGAGVDLNVRAAWPYTEGDGVTVAVVDDGIELTHPEFTNRVAGMSHYNFGLDTTNGAPNSTLDKHATAVAGFIAAEKNNGYGACGVAPKAHLASWKVVNSNSTASDENLAKMYLYCSNTVAVQNHSWGFTGNAQHMPGILENEAIEEAVQGGRHGLGVVMVRSSGNTRDSYVNANDSGYLASIHSIGVAATWGNGRVASYSTPGACLLVAAPGGDKNDPTGLSLFTTDRQGINGYNYVLFAPPYDTTLSDFCFGSLAFSGTSASAPQISGVVALMLSANANLSIRDVQQILILSSRHFDLTDPDLTTNGAGFRVSHNVGFGIPDAAMAVRLAKSWTPRPARVSATVAASALPAAIPDDGLRLIVNNSTNIVYNVAASSSLGLHPDDPTPFGTIVDVGGALSPITLNLTNKVALIRRGTNNFSDKIQYAANAGAKAAILYDTVAEDRLVMAGTDFSSIPAVFISQSDGEALQASLKTNSQLQAQFSLNAITKTFTINQSLLCEHVAVRVNIQHPLRADIRITLLSPMGTRSVMARVNQDASACSDWVYVSTHHFFESSQGVWTLVVSDEGAGATGTLDEAELTVFGTPIADADHDGLDDSWEMAHFGSLNFSAKEDPNGNGYNNMFEQLTGTDPASTNSALQVDINRYNASQIRLSWLSLTNRTYEVRGGSTPTNMTVLTNMTGRFPETDVILAKSNNVPQFFRIREIKP
jgi:subtilisin-like proprotein convertase family protein/subtilisin family serine protease